MPEMRMNSLKSRALNCGPLSEIMRGFGHSAADTLDKVEADILERDSALLALSSLWIADYPTTIGRHWSPEKTAQMLSEQRTALRALGLWPFSQ